MRIAFGAALAASVPAMAEGWYLSVAAGITRVESGLAQAHAADFDSPSTVSDSTREGAWRVGAGCVVTDVFAVELNYSDYGRQTLFVEGSPNPIVFPPEVLSQSRSTTRKVSAIGVDVVARMPLRDTWSIVARAGAAYATVKSDSHVVAPAGFPFGNGPTDFTASSTDRSVVPRIALGAGFEPAPRWHVDAMYELLASAGSDFPGGTGRARQATGWLALSRRF